MFIDPSVLLASELIFEQENELLWLIYAVVMVYWNRNNND